MASRPVRLGVSKFYNDRSQDTMKISEQKSADMQCAVEGTNTAQHDSRLDCKKRERKNRIVYVNGHPVLKENLYNIEDGEPSVFQKELNKDASKNLLAQHGASLRPQKRAATKVPARPIKKPARASVKLDSMAIARKAHNSMIKNEKSETEAARAVYLRRQLGKIKAFITNQVAESIVVKGAAAEHKVAQLPVLDPVSEQPAEILGTMREYQLQGLAWMVRCFDHGINAILADEMGLGKTLQTISFLAYLKYVRGVQGPHLVVVPLSVLSSWMLEFKKWCPTLRVVRLHVNDEGERARLRKEVLGNPSSFDVAVTTYDMVKSQHFGEALKTSIFWRYLVLDEGHKVKNEETRISQEMRRIHMQNVLLLTGTPVQNNLHELYALLNFMYPDVFVDSEPFDMAFNLSTNTVDDSKLEAAHHLLRPFLLRRVKDEVETSLPPKMETRISCPLTEMQTFWYRRLLLRDSSYIADEEKEEVKAGTKVEVEATRAAGNSMAQDQNKVLDNGSFQEELNPTEAGSSSVAMVAGGSKQSGRGGESFKRLMNLLMQLRKVCNHPYMFPEAEPDFDGVTTGEDLLEGSGKLKVLDKLLGKLKTRGHRVVLFSQFNLMLNIIEDYLIMRGYNYKRLDGSTNRVQRMIDIQLFNMPESEVFIYILCTRAGGLGVNLQTADTLILFDSDWNPQWDLQAMARVHRIGQTKPVHIYRFCTEGTVEERIQHRAEQKLYMDQMVNRGSTAAAEEMDKMDRKELMSMLQFGADRIFKQEEGKMPSEADLDALLDRSSIMKREVQQQQGPSSGVKKSSDELGSSSDAVKDEGGHQTAEKGTAMQEIKQTALHFNAQQAPLSSFLHGGVDYKQLRAHRESRLADIAQDFWANKKRSRTATTTQVKVQGLKGTVAVLKSNDYSMQQGGISVAHLAAPKAEPVKTRQTAGVDYDNMDFCQVCWDGGDLMLCDHCPVAVHASCIGLTQKKAEQASHLKWSCPHHTCTSCARSTGAAGGLLFRCEVCPVAYCEDCLPDEYQMVGSCKHFMALGQIPPKQACFILCSKECIAQKIEIGTELAEIIVRGEDA
ncbi:hypothetical protein CEUSTIGMA_g243.t1 [Chlamydomonas eustigma]|uniref:Uncharacterized protein n=1 Tax=Chlamydomonas eustigma TaxID=1157962 RepID=A0A250WPL6_9CHLO|nr:hypothetical protein CEUSTIGMA_g243.t1 [Chlamydomonas eustigma]|eukprot:GAX72787.1 hypothetical protein CEUSTIGMA_g243.t1 [Chlamydomonas eustigma]